MIRLSVIIPTHNRASSLRRTLQALAVQTADLGDFEVIVVADGCTDQTVAMVRSTPAPYSLLCIDQNPGRGAAGARNRGASEARGYILLFLDDDMEASPELISAHIRTHMAHDCVAVLGYFPMQPPQPDDDPFTMAARLWWAEGFNSRSETGYRFTIRDFCTGNVSVPREIFETLGGFDEKIDSRAAGEDYELAFRLLENDVRFMFVREAASVHHTTVPLKTELTRARQEGVGQSILVSRHPELFFEFNVSRLSRLGDSVWLRPIWAFMWRHPAVTAPFAALLKAVVASLASARAYTLLWKFHGVLRGYHYWLGVRDTMGTLASWERLAQDAPLEKPGAREIDVELSRDLSRLDEIFAGKRIDAVRLWLNGSPVGRIPPWAGAEPLTGEHLRNLLVQRFQSPLLQLLTEQVIGDRNDGWPVNVGVSSSTRE